MVSDCSSKNLISLELGQLGFMMFVVIYNSIFLAALKV